jgi:hypothetical protein
MIGFFVEPQLQICVGIDRDRWPHVCVLAIAREHTMKLVMTRLILFVSTLSVFAGPAAAAPIVDLLASVPILTESGRGEPGHEPYTEVGIVLQYSQAPPNGFSFPCIGCNFTLGFGQVGSFDFDLSNTPDFAAFAAKATDGIDQQLWMNSGFVGSAGFGGGGNSESGRGLGSPDLVGNTLLLVRLNLTLNEATSILGDDGRLNSKSSMAGAWEFWGLAGVVTPPPPPSPAPVPEPATMTLFGAGLAVTAWWRRKTQQKEP